MVVWSTIQVVILLAIAATFVWAFTRPFDDEQADVVKEKLFTALGAVLIGVSFLYLPWLRFNIFGYFGEAVETLVDFMPSMLTSILERWGPDGLETAGQLLGKLLDLLQINGWLLWLVTPDPREWAIVFRMVALLLPPFLSLLILLWSPFVSLVAMKTRSLGLNRIVSWLEVTIAGLAAFLLAAYLPEIDAWGTTGTLIPGLAATFLGTEVGWGIYIVMLGLALIMFGSYSQYRQKEPPISGTKPQAGVKSHGGGRK